MKALADNVNKYESQHGHIKDVDPNAILSLEGQLLRHDKKTA